MLTQQLDKHRRDVATVENREARVSSLLFDPKQAAKWDPSQMLDLGLNGFSALCSQKPGLRKYQDALFSNAIGSDSRKERHMLGKAENEALDEALNGLIRAMGGLLLDPNAHKVLEYLIRRFRVHTRNVDALISALLPYHETAFFTKMVCVPLQVVDTPWRFLVTVQKKKHSVTRQHLVKLGMSNPELVKTIAQSGLPRNGSLASPQAVAFYAVYLVEFLQVARSEETVSSLLPYILEGLKQTSHSDLQIASCAVLSALAQFTFLASSSAISLLNMLARRVLQASHSSVVAHLLKTASTIFYRQREMDVSFRLPEKFVTRLWSPDVDQGLVLEGLHACDPCALVGEVIRLTTSTPPLNADLDLLGGLVAELEMTQSRLRFVLKCLLTLKHAAQDVVPLIRTLSRKWPTFMDFVLNDTRHGQTSLLSAHAVFLEQECFSPESGLIKHAPLTVGGDVKSLVLALREPNLQVSALQRCLEGVDQEVVSVLLCVAEDGVVHDPLLFRDLLEGESTFELALEVGLAMLPLTASALQEGILQELALRLAQEADIIPHASFVMACFHASQFEGELLPLFSGLLLRLVAIHHLPALEFLGTHWKVAQWRKLKKKKKLDVSLMEMASLDEAYCLRIIKSCHVDALPLALGLLKHQEVQISTSLQVGCGVFMEQILTQHPSTREMVLQGLLELSSPMFHTLKPVLQDVLAPADAALCSMLLRASASAQPVKQTRSLRLLKSLLMSKSQTLREQDVLAYLLVALSAPEEDIRTSACTVGQLVQEAAFFPSLKAKPDIQRDATAVFGLVASSEGTLQRALLLPSLQEEVQTSAPLALTLLNCVLLVKDASLCLDAFFPKPASAQVVDTLKLVVDHQCCMPSMAVVDFCVEHHPKALLLPSLKDVAASSRAVFDKLCAFAVENDKLVHVIAALPLSFSMISPLMLDKEEDMYLSVVGECLKRYSGVKLGWIHTTTLKKRCFQVLQALVKENSRHFAIDLYLCVLTRHPFSHKGMQALVAQVFASTDNRTRLSCVRCLVTNSPNGLLGLLKVQDPSWSGSHVLQLVKTALPALDVVQDSVPLMQALVSLLMEPESDSIEAAHWDVVMHLMRLPLAYQVVVCLVQAHERSLLVCSRVLGQAWPQSGAQQCLVLESLVQFPACWPFINWHLSSKSFVQAFETEAALNNEEEEEFLRIMNLLNLVLVQIQAQEADVLLDISDKIASMCSVPMFVSVVGQLLQNSEDNATRRMALRQLSHKVREQHTLWDQQEVHLVLGLLDTLKPSLDVANLDPDLEDAYAETQTALLAIHILADSLCEAQPHAFQGLLSVLVHKTLQPALHLSTPTAGQACLTIGVFLQHLGIHAVQELNALCPLLLQAAESPADDGLVKESAVIVMKHLLQALGAFVSPFLQQICTVALQTDSESGQALTLELKDRVEPRLLLPALKEVLFTAIEAGHAEEVLRGFELLGLVLDKLDAKTLEMHIDVLISIMVWTLEHARVGLEEEECVMLEEDYYGPCLASMALLMNETRLKEMFGLMVENCVDKQEMQVMSLLHAVLVLGKQLRSLFVPFLNQAMDTILQTLTVSFEDSKKPEERKKKRKLASPLTVGVQQRAIQCLTLFFKYGVVEEDDLAKFLGPILDQLRGLQVDAGLYTTPCLAGLCVCLLNDYNEDTNAMWQTLHHRLLLLLKHQAWEVKMVALQTVQACFMAVGEEYLVLLPETLPFLAELLEDPREDIVHLAQQTVGVLSDLSGEDITSFLK